MVSRLPSIACLRAAEAVARHRSFSRAAVELNLTQTAISHQIRKLEELLGTELFLRNGRVISLTPQGEDYLADIRPLVVGISHATDRLASGHRDTVLRIGCPGTFLLKCLTPRIGEFIARHPDIEVRLLTLDPYSISDREGSRDFKDLSLIVRYGLGTFPGHDAYKISTERIFPVCSPALLGLNDASVADASLNPAILAQHRVIRATTPLLLRDDWPLWLETAGVPGLAFQSEITCDLLYSCFELAIQGVGMVMGRTPLIDNDIAAGRLIAPFSQSLLSASGYYLTVPYGRGANEPVRLFRDWFLETFDHDEHHQATMAKPKTGA
ncbi:LysR substrate-binding domain-containing protein [Thalassospira marina]|uniref:Transcriptional regulator n=1 Tax=Thalassospira marina TaxID=2048283 RepID=A0ABN5FCT0_9PROT|nr:LysR substrate-binding domain-containing protein [Thalassospira marina]AUG51890.1 transcriptional regulator [Thalassospira marina]